MRPSIFLDNAWLEAVPVELYCRCQADWARTNDQDSRFARHLAPFLLSGERVAWRFSVKTRKGLVPLNKTVDDLFLTRFIKINGELVTVYSQDSAIAEFLMEDAIADLKV